MRKLKKILAVILVVLLTISYQNTGAMNVNANVVKENTDLILTTLKSDEKRERVRERKELRERSSKTYEMSDGTYESVLYAEDIHYKDSDGEFVPIDNSIVDEEKKVGKDKRQYEFRNSANSYTEDFLKRKVFIQYVWNMREHLYLLD